MPMTKSVDVVPHGRITVAKHCFQHGQEPLILRIVGKAIPFLRAGEGMIEMRLACSGLWVDNMKTSTAHVPNPPTMYDTENDIALDRRSELNALMNLRLADGLDLQLQLKQAHWNVKGPNFIGLHELFDKVNAAVADYVDQIAERIVQLGGVAEGTVRTSAARSRLAEYPLAIGNGPAHIEAVSRALSTFGREARNMISEADELEDADTADLFTEVSRGVDKWLWFVEAHGQAST